MQEIGTIADTEINYNVLFSYSIMPVRIIVKVSENTAPDLRQQRLGSHNLEDLSKTETSLGITLEPVHPGVSDPTLASYFTVEVPDEDTAKRVIERLKLRKGVEGAYIKPSDELPGATI
jgi:hypothetical protein